MEGKMTAAAELQGLLGDMKRNPMLGLIKDGLVTLDSGAQAKTAIDLITGVRPRHILMEPLLVPLGVILYLIMKPVLTKICCALGTTGKSVFFKAFALIHNILLCSYSCWTSINVWHLTYVTFRQHGVNMYCDAMLWDRGLGYWGFLFYLSKYWELVDTFLLIWKQRKPSYLQVYHHAVTILCAYMLQASHARVTFLFVGLNAAVHTVMYAYYAMSVIGIRWKAKNLITAMQIVQFIVGIGLALPTFFLRGGTCALESQKIAVAGMVAHAAYLTILFVQFYASAYRGKGKIE